MTQLHISILDPLEALVQGPDPSRLRVGLAMPLTGNLALNGPSVIEALLLAGSEANEGRRRGERLVEYVLFDSNGDAVTAAAKVAGVASSGVVEAFVGLHTSATLQHVERRLKTSIPYIFAPGHEGDDRRAGFFCAGETPDQAIPALSWLMSERRVTEWAMVGTDYVWPRAMQTSLHSAIQERGGHVLLDRLIPLGTVRQRIGPILDAVARTDAAGIVINMSGRDVAEVILAMRQRGLDRRLVCLSSTLEENVLYAIDGDTSDNLYSVLHSFDSLTSARRLDLNDRYRARFGSEAPVFTNWAEHAYDGLQLLVALDREERLSANELGTPEGAPVASVETMEYKPHLALAAALAFEVVPTADDLA